MNKSFDITVFSHLDPDIREGHLSHFQYDKYHEKEAPFRQKELLFHGWFSRILCKTFPRRAIPSSIMLSEALEKLRRNVFSPPPFGKKYSPGTKATFSSTAF